MESHACQDLGPKKQNKIETAPSLLSKLKSHPQDHTLLGHGIPEGSNNFRGLVHVYPLFHPAITSKRGK